MNAEIFAEWLTRQRHRVLRTESGWWYEASPRVYQGFPYHWVIRPRAEEVADVLRRGGAIALRYSTPLDEDEGRVSYHIVCEDRGYDLTSLDRRSRQNVRNGLECCEVKQIPLERLASEGWELEVDTCRRQGRESAMNEHSWRTRYRAAACLPGFEAWGALVQGRLAASILAVQSGDCSELISQQCLTEFASSRVNNALIFVATQSMMKRPGVRFVFYTLQSLDAPPSVDEFKLRMAYVATPLRQRVAIHPRVAPLFGPWAHAVVRRLKRSRPASRVLAKAEGLIRFYREGKLPLAAQDWPTCLAKPSCKVVAGQDGRAPAGRDDAARELRRLPVTGLRSR
jgi:hypothetical protein